MQYKDIRPILYAEDSELFNKIFEKNGFSGESTMIDQLSLYDGRDREEAENSAHRFGCRISDNGDDVWLPDGLKYDITKGNDSYTEVIISRNGVEYPLNYIEDYDEFDVTFTELGKKLYNYAESFGFNLMDAYESVKSVETAFGVKIID